MSMWMMRERRSPGVKNGEDADAGTEMFGISRDGDDGLGRCLEQDVVDHGLVLIGDLGDWGGQREHDVEIRHRQELGLALGEPFLRGGALAFRAMPITAANGQRPLRALWANSVMGS